jgi:hypothetical protein
MNSTFKRLLLNAESAGSMASTRGRTVALLSVLAILAVILGAITAGLSSPLFGFSLSLPRQSSAPSPPPPPTGELLVKVLQYGASNDSVPIAGANVSITLDPQSTNTVLKQTNSSGELSLFMLTGNYTVSVSNVDFQTTKVVPVISHNLTVAAVTVIESVDQPMFSDLSDQDASGFVAPWQPISMAINSSSAEVALRSNAFFLQASYSSSTTSRGSAGNQVRAVVLSEPSNVTGTGPEWFTLQPTSSIRLNGLTDLAIATYSASMKVNVLGT